MPLFSEPTTFTSRSPRTARAARNTRASRNSRNAGTASEISVMMLDFRKASFCGASTNLSRKSRIKITQIIVLSNSSVGESPK